MSTETKEKKTRKPRTRKQPTLESVMAQASLLPIEQQVEVIKSLKESVRQEADKAVKNSENVLALAKDL